MENLIKPKEELQYEVTMNNAKHTSVQSIERLKKFHYSIYSKYFSDKTEGFIYNKMNRNGSWTWRWFADGKEAIKYMNK